LKSTVTLSCIDRSTGRCERVHDAVVTACEIFGFMQLAVPQHLQGHLVNSLGERKHAGSDSVGGDDLVVGMAGFAAFRFTTALIEPVFAAFDVPDDTDMPLGRRERRASIRIFERSALSC
jgi:hypothetical protein